MKRPEEFPKEARNGALEYQPTGHGNPDTDSLNYIVHPRHPEYSSIIWRLQAENLDAIPADTAFWPVSPAFEFPQRMMPPLGRFQVDTTAVRVLSEWIRGQPVPVGGAARRPEGGAPRVRGGLILLEGMADLPARAWLVDTRGVKHAVTASGPGRYRLPAGAVPGVYSLVLDRSRSYRIYLP